MSTKTWLKAAILTGSLTSLTTNQSIAQTLPNYSIYTDCRNGKLSDGATVHLICFKDKSTSRKELGIAVDGDPSKRLMTRGLRKVEFREDGYKNVVIYELLETIIDCKSNLIKTRTQATFFYGSAIAEREPRSAWTATENTKEEVGRMQRYCPAEPGYTRIGNAQIKTQGLLRAGSRVNSTIKNENGSRPISVDCKSLTFRVGDTEALIQPGSNGQKIYEALCK